MNLVTNGVETRQNSVLMGAIDTESPVFTSSSYSRAIFYVYFIYFYNFLYPILNSRTTCRQNPFKLNRYSCTLQGAGDESSLTLCGVVPWTQFLTPGAVALLRLHLRWRGSIGSARLREMAKAHVLCPLLFMRGRVLLQTLECFPIQELR